MNEMKAGQIILEEKLEDLSDIELERQRQHGQDREDCQLTGICIKILFNFCVFCVFSYFRLGALVGYWVENSVWIRLGTWVLCQLAFGHW